MTCLPFFLRSEYTSICKIDYILINKNALSAEYENEKVDFGR